MLDNTHCSHLLALVEKQHNHRQESADRITRDTHIIIAVRHSDNFLKFMTEKLLSLNVNLNKINPKNFLQVRNWLFLAYLNLPVNNFIFYRVYKSCDIK